MCEFFSICSDGKGKPYYFDWAIRSALMKDNPKHYEQDSHTSIADYYGFKKEKEDQLNKYEYNPLTKVFTIDQINAMDDSTQIEKFCNKLDFSTIVPVLKIKPIVHPFKINHKKITKRDIAIVSEWASVRDSVRDSVRASVWASVWDSVRDSVGASVRASVGASVGDSVGDSVRDSVGDSVRDSVGVSVGASVRASVGVSVGASVWDSVGAYAGTFFDIKYKHDFSSVQKLWEKGLVPSFDGVTWRLHGGPKGAILWECKKENLKGTR